MSEVGDTPSGRPTREKRLGGGSKWLVSVLALAMAFCYGLILVVFPSSLQNLLLDTLIMPAESLEHPMNRTSPENSPPVCSMNTIESIRAGGIHWHNEAADANVSIYHLEEAGPHRNTLGVLITTVGGKTSQKLDRRALMQQYERENMKRNISLVGSLPALKMSPTGDGRKAPAYEQYLGCGGSRGRMPNGTAVVVVQNFYCANMWHALANLHGIWLLMKVLEIQPSQVTAVLPHEYGAFKSPPKYAADILWPLFARKSDVSEVHTQTGCFERVAFIETPNYRPGPYWPLQGIKERCPAQTPYMRTHFLFRTEANDAALRALGTDNRPPIDETRDKRPVPVVCYMSRRLRKGRLRYFTEQLEPLVEDSLDKWAKQNEDRLALDKLEFTEATPFAEQWKRARQCSVLFGPHGAGLGHMIWMPAGGHVVEFGSELQHSECADYYEAMAQWYHHSYTCFSSMSGHNVLLKKSMYQSFNVTLLLRVLDKVVAKK